MGKRILGVKKSQRRGTRIQTGQKGVRTPKEIRDYHQARRKEEGLPQDFRDIEIKRTEGRKIIKAQIPAGNEAKLKKLLELLG